MTPAEEDDFRLRKSVEYLAHCREVENEARRALAAAAEQTKRAKEKHEAFFMEVEKRAGARVLASQSYSKNY